MRRKRRAKAHGGEHVLYETSKGQIKTQGHLGNKRQRHSSGQVTGGQRVRTFLLFENSLWPHIYNPSIQEGWQVWSQCECHSQFKAMQCFLARTCLKNTKLNQSNKKKVFNSERIHPGTIWLHESTRSLSTGLYCRFLARLHDGHVFWRNFFCVCDFPYTAQLYPFLPKQIFITFQLFSHLYPEH